MDYGAILTAALPALIQSGAGLFGGLFKGNDPSGDTLATLQYNREKLAQDAMLQKEQLAQQLAIAQMQAAASGAGAGSAVQAARIQQQTALRQLQQQRAADMLNAGLKGQEILRPDLLASVGNNRANLMQRGGETGIAGFNQIVQNLLAARGRQ